MSPKTVSILSFVKQYWFLIIFIIQAQFFIMDTYFTVKETASDIKTGQAVDQAIISCLIDHGLNPYKYFPNNTILKSADNKDAKHEELLTIRGIIK